MSSNFEMTPQELYVDWPEQPWPRLPGQLGRKQLRRGLLDVLKHLSNKAKLRIGPSARRRGCVKACGPTPPYGSK